MTTATPEIKRLDTSEQFTQETWLSITPDIWKPINTTPAKLAELRDQVASLPQAEKDARARAFIEANRAPDAPTWALAQAAATTATAGIGAELWGLLKDATWEAMAEVKKPWFWKGHMGDFMKDALEGMLEAKKEGGIMGFFAGIGLMFLKPFAKKLWLSEEQLKELGIDVPVWSTPTTSVPSAPTALRTQVNQWPRDLVVQSTAGYFLRKTHERGYNDLWSAVWAGTKDAWNSDETEAKKAIEKEAKVILGWNGLAGKTYTEIIAHKDDPDIATKLGLTGLNTKTQIPALRLAVSALAVNEAHIQELIWGKHSNWRELPLHTFLENFYVYTGMATVTKVADMVKDIDFKDPGKYAEAIRNLAIAPNSDGSLGGYVGERLSAYKSQWIDEEVVRRIVIPGTQWEQTVENFRSGTLVHSRFVEDLAQTKMTDITQKNGFPKSVVWLMNVVWLEQYTPSLNDGEELTMEELLIVYVITGWQNNIDALSQGQKNELIPVLYAIAARKNPNSFAVGSAINFIQSPTNTYVKKMADFVWTAMSDAVYISTFQSLNLTLKSAETLLELRDNPDPEKAKYFWYIMGAIALGLWSVIFLRKPVLSVFLSTTLIIWIAQLAGISLVAK